MNAFRKRLTRKLSLLAVVLLIAALMAPTSTLAAAETFTVSTKFPIDIVVFVPCANGGAGEEVYLTGSLHDLFHVTFDTRGGFHVTGHNNPQGVRGIGLTTGVKYQGTGVTRFHDNGKVGFESTFVNNFRIIGQGPGNNFMVHENFHFTVNANGTVTAEHDNFKVTCK